VRPAVQALESLDQKRQRLDALHAEMRAGGVTAATASPRPGPRAVSVSKPRAVSKERLDELRAAARGTPEARPASAFAVTSERQCRIHGLACSSEGLEVVCPVEGHGELLDGEWTTVQDVTNGARRVRGLSRHLAPARDRPHRPAVAELMRRAVEDEDLYHALLEPYLPHAAAAAIAEATGTAVPVLRGAIAPGKEPTMPTEKPQPQRDRTTIEATKHGNDKGHYLWVRLERAKSVPFCVRWQLTEGADKKAKKTAGVAATAETEAAGRKAYTEQLALAVKRGWVVVANAGVGGRALVIREIPSADVTPAAGAGSPRAVRRTASK
jgi:hypothetical protein